MRLPQRPSCRCPVGDDNAAMSVLAENTGSHWGLNKKTVLSLCVRACVRSCELCNCIMNGSVGFQLWTLSATPLQRDIGHLKAQHHSYSVQTQCISVCACSQHLCWWAKWTSLSNDLWIAVIAHLCDPVRCACFAAFALVYRSMSRACASTV